MIHTIHWTGMTGLIGPLMFSPPMGPTQCRDSLKLQIQIGMDQMLFIIHTDLIKVFGGTFTQIEL